MDGKYVIFDSPVAGEFPVLFPASVKHSMIVECVTSKYPVIKPVRAGHVHTTSTGEFHCYGGSQSLRHLDVPGADTMDGLIMNVLFKEGN